MTPDGPLPSSLDDARRGASSAVAALEPEAVAVCLLHAYRHPEHEQALGEALAERCRTSTSRSRTRSSAPSASTSARRRPRSTPPSPPCSPPTCAASSSARARPGLPEPAVMQSSGGLASLEQAADHAVLTVLSGPAGGAAGAAWAAARRGRARRAVLRHGRHVAATSASCSTARCARPPGARSAAGPVALPMLDIHTVGAGGGSIAWRDAGGALRVGPRSRRRAARARLPTATAARSRRSPTRTSLLGLLARGASLAAGSRSTARRPRRRSTRSADALGLEPLRERRGDRPRRQRRDGPRAARDDRRARRRPARARADGLRRRRRPARRRRSPRSSG